LVAHCGVGINSKASSIQSYVVTFFFVVIFFFLLLAKLVKRVDTVIEETFITATATGATGATATSKARESVSE